MSKAHRFTAELEAGRGGGAMVLVPPDIATALGGLKQIRAVGTVNEVPYQSSVMPYGGDPGTAAGRRDGAPPVTMNNA